jgi:transposase, IS30 family
MHYTHFSIEEREKIQEMLWQKASVREIARALGRHYSSVSREIARNRPPEKNRYTPRVAHERALRYRRRRGGRKLDGNERLRAHVLSRLKLGWSPEQSAATAREAVGMSISHEAIYQYIYAQVYRGGQGYVKPGHEDLRGYLPRRRKHRMRKGLRRPYRIEKGPLPSIDERPDTVAARVEVGHWEDDSLIYTPTSPVRLRSTNKRLSGVVFIARAHDRTMREANRITRARLGALPARLRRTLTRDRGAENLGYEELEQTLGIRCFFAHAYHSWERGSNENLNGLIRRFFPKGTDFSALTDEEIQQVEHLLNTRPRKRLGWKTPYQIFYDLTGVDLSAGVALRG